MRKQTEAKIVLILMYPPVMAKQPLLGLMCFTSIPIYVSYNVLWNF